MPTTTEIIDKFVEDIDTDNEYTLNELVAKLSIAYGVDVNTAKKTKAKKDTEKDDKPRSRSPKKDKKIDEPVDEKKKRAPSAYNLYVKDRVATLKMEMPDTPPKELLSVAAAEWKNLTDEEKAKFKST